MKFSSSANRPNSWQEMTIAEVCRIFTSGGTPSRKKPEYFENGTIPWVKTKELNDGVVVDVEEYITQDALKNSSAKILPKNTVLLAMYGATVGKLGVLGIEASCNQACAAMVPTEGVADYRFLYYLLLNHREKIVGQATGGAQQNLSGELIKGFTFDFPTFEEQKAIADVLWNLDAKIASNVATSKMLEDMTQAMFRAWFVDFDPSRRKLEGQPLVGLDDETADFFPSSMIQTELGLIPEGWKASTLGELITPKKGKTITKATSQTGNVPVVGGGLNPAYFHDTSNVSEPVVTISASGANAGFVRLYQQDIWASDCSFISREITENVFFWYLFLMKNQEQIYGMQQGAAQPHIYPSDLMRLKVAVPKNDQLISKFELAVTPFFNQIGALKRQSDTLLSLRDFLLPRLISGELEIPKEMMSS
jgi:type I restriction enzyme S subunit